MRIVLLPSVDGDVIAWEELFGRREGRFILAADGSVVHRDIWDDGEWYAGGSESQFRAAADAWNAYSEAVLGVPEAEQQVAVDRLRVELNRLGVISGPARSLWDVLLEQAEAGML
jgi:hypothetical protein